ncbi:hypothetical protein A2U01_0082085, partial [Trifolium medium]|nr:hypothetical protein [Trifolium medium]
REKRFGANYEMELEKIVIEDGDSWQWK